MPRRELRGPGERRLEGRRASDSSAATRHGEPEAPGRDRAAKLARAMRLAKLAAPATFSGAIAARSWYRRFEWAGRHDEHFVTTTDDGWQISVFHYRHRGTKKPYPVVAGHGFAGSHLIFDLADESPASFLASRGYDVYTVDLRGRGESWPKGGANRRLQWSFDDFARYDLPAAIRAACEHAGASEAFWLGVEMSGLALYAACIIGVDAPIRGGITCGSPAITPPDALVPGITSAPKVRLFGRVPFRSGARLAGPLLAYTRAHSLESSFRPSNTDPLVTARYFYSGVPDESTLTAKQFSDWARNQVMRSLDHSVVYSERLNEVTLPLLLLVGAKDLQRPESAVRHTFDELGSKDKRLVVVGKAEGFSTDAGHDDLLTGRAATSEVLPLVASWLDEHSA